MARRRGRTARHRRRAAARRAAAAKQERTLNPFYGFVEPSPPPKPDADRPEWWRVVVYVGFVALVFAGLLAPLVAIVLYRWGVPPPSVGVGRYLSPGRLAISWAGVAYAVAAFAFACWLTARDKALGGWKALTTMIAVIVLFLGSFYLGFLASPLGYEPDHVTVLSGRYVESEYDRGQDFLVRNESEETVKVCAGAEGVCSGDRDAPSPLMHGTFLPPSGYVRVHLANRDRDVPLTIEGHSAGDAVVHIHSYQPPFNPGI